MTNRDRAPEETLRLAMSEPDGLMKLAAELGQFGDDDNERLRSKRPGQAPRGTGRRSGQTAVPCGAFSFGFTGPSPPAGQVHTYQFSVKALGPNGAVLATTATRRRFPK